jgi:hypothetical protein
LRRSHWMPPQNASAHNSRMTRKLGPARRMTAS